MHTKAVIPVVTDVIPTLFFKWGTTLLQYRATIMGYPFLTNMWRADANISNGLYNAFVLKVALSLGNVLWKRTQITMHERNKAELESSISRVLHWKATSELFFFNQEPIQPYYTDSQCWKKSWYSFHKLYHLSNWSHAQYLTTHDSASGQAECVRPITIKGCAKPGEQERHTRYACFSCSMRKLHAGETSKQPRT